MVKSGSFLFDQFDPAQIINQCQFQRRQATHFSYTLYLVNKTTKLFVLLLHLSCQREDHVTIPLLSHHKCKRPINQAFWPLDRLPFQRRAVPFIN